MNHPSILLLDGATGSELERRGHDTSLPLWSARALLECPEAVEQIHREYLEAGADAITTNTFRTHGRSMAKAGFSQRARELTLRAVEIAQHARDAVNPAAAVFGSVSPLEDCYQPALALPFDECKIEHRQIVQHLVEGGVDRILIETMNNLDESRAAIRAASDLAPGRWMVSFCLRHKGPAGALLSGESLAELMPECAEARAIGVNCVPAQFVEAQVRYLRANVSSFVAIMAYANVGCADDERGWVNTDAVSPDVYASYALRWRNAGAEIIGGCCGTSPATIRAMRDVFSR